MLAFIPSVPMNKAFFKSSKVKFDKFFRKNYKKYNAIYISYENTFHDVSNDIDL
jgi:hypothetical protein